MKFNEIPKFVVNLDRRPDRLEEITKEMKYLEWDFQRFPAIDTNSYMGITKSTAFGADQTSIGLQVGYKPREYYKRVTIYLTL